jgi:hypothetical protein
MSITRLVEICCVCSVVSLAFTATSLASGDVTNRPAAPPQSVEMKFMPKPAGTHNQGAWTRLAPFEDRIMAQATLGIGDWCPVARQDQAELFRVHMISGDDAAIALEARAGKTIQKISLKKDGQAICNIAGGKFEFNYPRCWVATSSLPKTGTSGMNELTSEGHVSRIMLLIRLISE